MGKLIFRYGTMGSSKTVEAIIKHYNYQKRNLNSILLKPKCETRDGIEIISSRTGLTAECGTVESFLQHSFEFYHTIDAVIIDECQFLSAEQIESLADLADVHKMVITCYGLSTDFRGYLFPASKRLFELADEIQRISNICWCGKEALFSARVENGQIVKEGDLIQLGADETYVPLCRKHFHSNKLSNGSQ